MAMAESLDARLARLEGSYEQIDRRLGSIDERLGRLEAKVDALGANLQVNRTFDGLNRSLDKLYAKTNLCLYAIIVAILTPIVIRVFFP